MKSSCPGRARGRRQDHRARDFARQTATRRCLYLVRYRDTVYTLSRKRFKVKKKKFTSTCILLVADYLHGMAVGMLEMLLLAEVTAKILCPALPPTPYHGLLFSLCSCSSAWILFISYVEFGSSDCFMMVFEMKTSSVHRLPLLNSVFPAGSSPSLLFTSEADEKKEDKEEQSTSLQK